MYNQNYYVGIEKTTKPYDLNISKNKTNLYSNIKSSRVWSEIRNSAELCLGNINNNYLNKHKIDKATIKKDYLIFLPCDDSNVLHFYQYTIKTVDTIVKVGENQIILS